MIRPDRELRCVSLGPVVPGTVLLFRPCFEGAASVRMIVDRLRPKRGQKPNPLSVAILFATLVAVFPLAYAFGRWLDLGWLASTLAAVAIAVGLAIGALLLIRK
jgi:hypothetical protein